MRLEETRCRHTSSIIPSSRIVNERRCIFRKTNSRNCGRYAASSANACVQASLCGLKSCWRIHPLLALNDEAVLELIHAEVSTRKDMGERPTLEEWEVRFPRLLPRVEQIVSLRTVFDSEMPTLTDSSAAGTEGYDGVSADDGRAACGLATTRFSRRSAEEAWGSSTSQTGQPEPYRRPQDDTGRRACWPAGTGAAAQRGPGGRAVNASQRRADIRDRRTRGASLSGHGVCRGREFDAHICEPCLRRFAGPPA